MNTLKADGKNCFGYYKYRVATVVMSNLSMVSNGDEKKSRYPGILHFIFNFAEFI